MCEQPLHGVKKHVVKRRKVNNLLHHEHQDLHQPPVSNCRSQSSHCWQQLLRELQCQHPSRQHQPNRKDGNKHMRICTPFFYMKYLRIEKFGLVICGNRNSSSITLFLPKSPSNLVHGRIYKPIHLRSLVTNIKYQWLKDKNFHHWSKRNNLVRVCIYSMIFIYSQAKGSNVKKERTKSKFWNESSSQLLTSVHKIPIWHETNGPYLNKKLHAFQRASSESHKKRSADSVEHLVTLTRKIEKISALTWYMLAEIYDLWNRNHLH